MSGIPGCRLAVADEDAVEKAANGRGASLVAVLLLALLAPLAVAEDLPRPADESAGWIALPGIRDIQFTNAIDLTPAVRGGAALVALPAPIEIEGLACDALLVGEGDVVFTSRAIEDSGALARVEGAKTRRGARIDVLAGDDVRLAADGRVLAVESNGMIAIRWIALRASSMSGDASIVELVVLRDGHVVVQLLHLPASARSQIDAGRVVALGVDGAPSLMSPATATAWLRDFSRPFEAIDPPDQRPAQGGPPPAGCDAEILNWCWRAGVGCSNLAGLGFTSCGTRVTTAWSFNEQDFCKGCLYTFYVLVECGREMHVPVEDMEGMEMTISDVLTGTRPTLRCLNDAALGDPPLLVSCPSHRYGYGPPFDRTSPDGQMSWGFPDCIVDADLSCSDVPPGDGGPVARASPGEQQTMDCYISAESGLCGLYRMDIRSGGNVWQLFANCIGDNVPQFQIFSDCTQAWAAFNPLPELAVANMRAIGNCPNVDVEFDLQNIGCVDRVGGVTLRLASNCAPADTLTFTVPDTIPANGSVTVTVPFTTSCDPVRLDIFVDPSNAISECTESPTVAACRASPGVDTLSAFACGCTAQLAADAGPSRTACTGATVTLDGSTSTLVPCAAPRYRWLDGAGNEIQALSSDPTVDVVFSGCPASETYVLEVSCQGEICVDAAAVRIDCFVPDADAGADVLACNDENVRLTGADSVVPGCALPLYRWFDPHGVEIRGWNSDAHVDITGFTCGASGAYRLEVACTGGGACTGSDEVNVACVVVAADAGPDVVACAGEEFTITSAGAQLTNCTEAEYRWLDATTLQPLTTFDSDPDFSGTMTTCPDAMQLLLEARCADSLAPGCTSYDAVEVTCDAGVLPRPSAVPGCGLVAALACGAAAPGLAGWWDLDTSVDSDLDGDPADDEDVQGCDANGAWPSGLRHVVRSFTRNGLGCVAAAELVVDLIADPAPPRPVATPGCPGSASALTCGAAGAGLRFEWDLDLATDSSGNGIPDDDIDATTCDTARAYVEGRHAVRVVLVDARNCSSSSDLAFDVMPFPAPPVPAAVPGCAGTPSALSCRAPGPGLTFAWDLDVSSDSSGNGIPDDDVDATTCDASRSYPAGSHVARVTISDARGCSSSGDVGFDVLLRPETPAPVATPSCPGVTSTVTCGAAAPGLTFAWDLDLAADSSGNGIADDDVDATTCDAGRIYAVGSYTARVTATAPGGCASSADLSFNVVADAVPGEATNLRVSRAGAAVTLRWTAAPGAGSYRFVRGDLGTWYSHAADDPVGRGACDAGGGPSVTDPDDGAEGPNYYYLVIGVSPCEGLLGTSGFGFRAAPFERPGPIPTPSCP